MGAICPQCYIEPANNMLQTQYTTTRFYGKLYLSDLTMLKTLFLFHKWPLWRFSVSGTCLSLSLSPSSQDISSGSTSHQALVTCSHLPQLKPTGDLLTGWLGTDLHSVSQQVSKALLCLHTWDAKTDLYMDAPQSLPPGAETQHFWPFQCLPSSQFRAPGQYPLLSDASSSCRMTFWNATPLKK